MSIRRYRAPTPDQELLLQACFLDGPDAIAAWTQWRGHVDPEQLDEDSSRLLPMLYDALRKHGISDPGMGRLKNAYRQTWYDNTLRFHLAATVLRALHEAGIQTMLLKGPALVLRYYGDVGLRPMEDVDILVPTHLGPAAIDILKGLGWTPVFELVGFTEGVALEVGHAYP